ncbi:MAG: hypothetical protein EPN93_11345 [Spirochaetes bacterium]|nr:MAG: hypothetical protein EPN93_11345 [Spirochaetota bacterium]
MKKFASRTLLIAVAVACLVSAAFAFSVGGKEMVLNGTGSRSIFMLGSVYYAFLYVPDTLKGKDGTEILEADAPMSVVLLIDSGMLTRDRFFKAIREGFEKAAGAGYATDQAEAFLSLFGDVEMKKGDYVYLSYDPASGLAASLQPAGGAAKFFGTIPGLGFKKALYAIWLGPNPVQESCKNGMLGR